MVFSSGAWCREPDLNRHGHYCPLDFKSKASANSAIPALKTATRKQTPTDKWSMAHSSVRNIPKKVCFVNHYSYFILIIRQYSCLELN